jgi:DNA-directed RNA polymerase subunit RPC12/RpoP
MSVRETLECGCSVGEQYFRCPRCGHRRCATHRGSHDSASCAKVAVG